ncbi:MAG TPA: SDR family NAD(P)-dependent oxidoreductase [Streptosporangiaceae bacterium]|nr:SDR family NAD(P)-dependent oxidoreductase [Streptosporangiaceae bacterium]
MATTRQVALITGASAGIGKACADRLAAAGWTVTGASRRGTGGDADGAAAANRAANNRAANNRADTAPPAWTGLVMDVDQDSSVQAGVAGVLERDGQIDALVAAAGWGIAGAAEYTSIAEAKAQFETNFWGCVRVVQAVLPQMRKQNHGRIVLISSIGGVIGIPFQAYYSASKFALEGFAEALAYEVAPFAIEVTLVQPGNVATDFTASRRRAEGRPGDAAYAAAMTRAVSIMERDEAAGAPAEHVAMTVQRVLESSRAPRRVSVGKAGERVGLIAKRLLPFRVFEAAAKGSLGV